MRVFRNKPFSRFSWKNGILDSNHCDSVRDAVQGLIAADLGGGAIKQRIARGGEGKSGGFRVMILLKLSDRAILVHGFAKSDIGNISANELVALKKLAYQLLGYSDAELDEAVSSGSLTEVRCDGRVKTIS